MSELINGTMRTCHVVERDVTPLPPHHTHIAHCPSSPPAPHLAQPRLVYVKVQLMAWVAGRGPGVSPPLYARRGGGGGRGAGI